MMTDRENFEAWFRSAYEHLDSSIHAEIIDNIKSVLWMSWQAALASQQPADDGWIEWCGGECPVKLNAMVEVKHRSEKWCNSRITAAVADWRRKSWCPDTDIIAYRVVKL